MQVWLLERSETSVFPGYLGGHVVKLDEPSPVLCHVHEEECAESKSETKAPSRSPISARLCAFRRN
jgi:hypothetical protein